MDNLHHNAKHWLTRCSSMPAKCGQWPCGPAWPVSNRCCLFGSCLEGNQLCEWLRHSTSAGGGFCAAQPNQKKRSRVQNKTIITRQNRKEVKWKLRSGSGIFDGCLFWRIDVELWNVTISWCENDLLQVTIIVITKFQVLQRTAKFTDQRVNTKQVRRAQLPPGSENKSPMGLTLGLTAPWWAYPVMHVPNYV